MSAGGRKGWVCDVCIYADWMMRESSAPPTHEMKYRRQAKQIARRDELFVEMDDAHL